MTHATNARDVLAPRSTLYQGPYGRIFGDLPPWRPSGVSDDQLEATCLEFANRLMSETPAGADGSTPSPSEISSTQQADGLQSDPTFGGSIPAGYTYFGQFVDHDITFDPTSSLQRYNDPDKLLNFRTPRLDLDNLYGRGPDDQPYLYDHHDSVPRGTLLVPTAAHDLPRNEQGRALIGDPRNDENTIVSQLHLAFLNAHNELVVRAAALNSTDPFEEARRTLRWLYQCVVWNDLIARVTDQTIHAAALQKTPSDDGRVVWRRSQKDLYNWHDQPYIPVEFSGAAYRFGHSMVRNSYQTNIKRGAGVFLPIFDSTVGSTSNDLRGFRAVDDLSRIQWDWFLPMQAPTPFPQTAHRIDTKLARALFAMPEGGADGSTQNTLAARNLLRAIRLELPAGTAVARQLGVAPSTLAADEPDALWYYILKEAEATGGEHLGAVGSTIVTSVFAGLLTGDPQSWINIDPAWTPAADRLLTDTGSGPLNRDDPNSEWRLSSIIRLSGVPVSANDFSGA